MRQVGPFGLSEHLKRLSAYGNPLEVLDRVVDFEAFRPTFVASSSYSDGAKGGRPPYDSVTMLKVLILAAQNNVSDAHIEYLIRDRPSGLRFPGFDLGAPTPDANTIRTFRDGFENGDWDRLTQAQRPSEIAHQRQLHREAQPIVGSATTPGEGDVLRHERVACQRLLVGVGRLEQDRSRLSVQKGHVSDPLRQPVMAELSAVPAPAQPVRFSIRRSPQQKTR